MCPKNEMQTKVLSLTSSNFSKSLVTFKIVKLCISWETTTVQKCARDFCKSDVLTQSNQITHDGFSGTIFKFYIVL